MMRDGDVRQTLRDVLRQWHGPEPHARIVEEFGIGNGDVRVDLVAIDDWLHGYEIKSDADTLTRLPTQARRYSQVLDRVTLVVGERHHSRAKRLVPEWWGVMTAVPIRPGLVRLYPDRPGEANPQVDPFALAGLLWREEALEVLESMDALGGLRSRARPFLFNRMIQIFSLEELHGLVRGKLKSRTDWRLESEQVDDEASEP